MGKILIGTACTGIGSPEYALREMGIEHQIVVGVEIDKYARQTYLENFKPDMMFEDMTQNDWTGHYVDLLCAGIPCQSFSLAGKRLGELDPRGLLFYNFYEYVKIQKPKYFIIENVKGLLSTENVFETWLELLGQSVNNQHNMFNHDDSLMYNLHWTVLNTKDFGLPQNRERVFIIGIRPDLPNTFRFPIGFQLTTRLKDILEPVVDEKYYLSDKMLEYMNTRAANFNGGKINYKTGEDTASCINASSKSIDISDNIIVVNDNGNLEPKDIFNTLDANYHKGMDNHGQRSFILEPPQIDVLGNVGNGHEAQNVYNKDGIAPCVREMHGKVIKVVVDEPKIIGYTRDADGKVIARHLKDEAGTIHTSSGSGGNTDQFVLEPAILSPQRTEFGKETRKEYEAGNLKLDRSEIQSLVPRTDGISNTISTVQKDNLLFEPFCVAMRGRTENKGEDWHNSNHVQKLEKRDDGVTNTISSIQKDNLIVEPGTLIVREVRTEEAKKQRRETGSNDFRDKTIESDVANCIQTGLTKDNLIVDEGISTTIKSEGGGLGAKTGLYETRNRIRRLTPRECGRLQGFSDDFKQPVSDTQKYRQYGNTISTSVIKAILVNLLK